jgi:hypothetical protein
MTRSRSPRFAWTRKMAMKQRKEFQKTAPQAEDSASKKQRSSKSLQELTELIHQSIGKNPSKAAKVIELWVKDVAKPNKKAS